MYSNKYITEHNYLAINNTVKCTCLNVFFTCQYLLEKGVSGMYKCGTIRDRDHGIFLQFDTERHREFLLKMAAGHIGL